jgi:exodeoxyribonuclease VII small subunit
MLIGNYSFQLILRNCKFMSESTDSSTPNFEQSLTRLDEIARALEDNKLGLQESLGVYEEGVKLLRSCKAMLETAERQVELLTGFDAAGNPVTTPFDDTATIDRSARGSTSKSSAASTSSSDADVKLTTETIDVSARTTSTAKKSRKKSTPASDSPQSSSSESNSPSSPASTSSASSSARDSSQLAPWEELTNNSESDDDGDSKIDESGRLF